MIDAGLMTHRVTLQSPGTGGDGLDTALETWTDVATVWAQVQPLRGKEYTEARSLGSEAEVRIRIWYRADVTSAWRVLWRGVPHVLVAPPIDVAGQARALELMCASGAKAV